MFADPQSLTIAGTATSFARTGMSLDAGKFAAASGKYTLDIAHTNGKRVRHVIKLSLSDVVANPLVPDQNQAVGASVHLVVDAPRNGIAIGDQVNLAKALVAACTDPQLTKLISGES